MKEFKNKVAVVTGAASGIGRGLAERCVQEGMNVCLTDVDSKALEKLKNDLSSSNVKILTEIVDVSKEDQVVALAGKVFQTFGSVHLLFNNAGVQTMNFVWESSQRDWEWVFGVNVYGTVHGIRAFLPEMLKQDQEGHIVNTASFGGFAYGMPGFSIYQASKSAVVSLSETLFMELKVKKAKIKTSVLCPAWVKTNMIESAKHRPVSLQDANKNMRPEVEASIQFIQKSTEKVGISPQKVAECVFNGIRDEKFYIFTHPDLMPFIQKRIDNVMQSKDPS